MAGLRKKKKFRRELAGIESRLGHSLGPDFGDLKTNDPRQSVLHILGYKQNAVKALRGSDEAAKVLGGPNARARIEREILELNPDFSKHGFKAGEVGMRLRNLDAAAAAKRQQREGVGTQAQGAAVRRALALARGRKGTILGTGNDPGRKNVLGSGI